MLQLADVRDPPVVGGHQRPPLPERHRAAQHLEVAHAVHEGAERARQEAVEHDAHDLLVAQALALVQLGPVPPPVEGLAAHGRERAQAARGEAQREAVAARRQRLAFAGGSHGRLGADSPLWELSNVIITPHISGSSLSPHFKTRLWDIVYENVRRFISHEPLFNELRPGQLSA